MEGFLRQNAVMFQRVTERKEWQFFSALLRATPGLALVWWSVLLLRGMLPAAFAIAMGVLVGAVQRGVPLAGPLALVVALISFTCSMVVTPRATSG